MILENKDYRIDYATTGDLDKFVNIYNSNLDFLITHIGVSKIDLEWITKEFKEMQSINFNCCKVIDKKNYSIIGLLDFRLGEISYLSLLMIHKDYKSKGIGKQIYNLFERYLQSSNSQSIRIDVVNNYNKNVYKFWTDLGFEKVKDIELEWSKKNCWLHTC
ncbi:GNAT family N-acetyltransferase (plasmid) [Paraclostridium benzoelyticum]|uniref:GNAT family N-acetyltransferase n=1 Tax=Paraclostridium benzoelyticum TaxID=1629550 RepID=UPI0031CD1FFC